MCDENLLIFYYQYLITTIGIRDCGITIKPGHLNFYHSYLFNEGLNNETKEHLCLFGGFGISDQNKIPFYNYFKTYDFNMTSQWGKIPVLQFYK